MRSMQRLAAKVLPQVDGAHHKHVRKFASTRPPKTRLKKLAAACETCAVMHSSGALACRQQTTDKHRGD